MKKEELIKRIEAIEKTLNNMLPEIIFEIEPQERKLIMSVDEVITLDGDNAEWWKDNKEKLELFGKLKLIEQNWNEGKAFDWEGGFDKNGVFLFKNQWWLNYEISSNSLFNFHKKEHAQLFLKTFEKELEIIKPLFS